jgi:hypothetical protein
MTKAILLLAILLVAVIFVSGCTESNSKTYTIEITGNYSTCKLPDEIKSACEHVPFSGSIGSAGNTRSIEGDTPQQYDVVGWPVSAAIQKNTDADALLIVMIKDQSGKIIAQQSTTAPYGMVTVSSG